MPRSTYFSYANRAEQNLYEDLVIESLRIYGQDVYYLPRKIVNQDTIMGEDIASNYDDAYMIEMYLENIEGFEGDQNILSKFGVEIRDQATMIVSKKIWERQVGRWDNSVQLDRPAEGDLIFIPLTNALFEIRFVEHELPFYQMSRLPIYKLTIEKFEYSNEDFNTGIDEINYVSYKQGFERAYITNSIASEFEPTFTPSIENPIYIKQVFTDFTIEGKATRYEKIQGEVDRYILHIQDEASTDGEYHKFAVNKEVLDENNNSLFTIVDEIAYTDPNDLESKNQFIEQEADDIIDWSEDNPFGEV